MATPMLDDLELKAVQWIREETDAAFARQRVVGLDGTLHQKVGRASHRVELAGAFLPATSTDDLKTLQQKAAAGDEVTFTADITTALDVQKYVIESIAAEQVAGVTGQLTYRISLAESPPLPAPAQVDAFGGLGDFGLGDLGFDPSALGDVLGDITDAAGSIMSAADGVIDAVKSVAALANLGNLADIGNPVAPLVDKVKELDQVGPLVTNLAASIGKLTAPQPATPPATPP